MRPTPPSPAWTPERLADRLPALAARARIASALRGHLADDGFIEVETPILQVSPGNEAHLHAFTTAEIGPDGTATPLYLHTSPEFACKKLLAAGATRLFTLARVFRNRERGPLHHPEFTMLEWYRAGEPYRSVIADSLAFLQLAAEAAGTDRLQWRGMTCDPSAEAEWLTLAQAFDRFANIDLLATTPGGVPDRDALAKASTIAGVRVAEDDVWADIFSRVLVEKIEPHLGYDRPTVLYEYPVCEAALARPAADPRVAERFELYACGVELANGFGELTDAAEQRRRFLSEMDEKQRVYGERYPLDDDFLAALAHMPEASGVALGFDRLVMLATGARRIEDVLWLPVAEPHA